MLLRRPELNEPLNPSGLQIDRALLDQLPVMVWFDNALGKCIYVNEAGLAFTGRTFEQEQGEGWITSVHPADRENYLAAYRSARQAKRLFEVEYRLRRHDGEYRWVMERGSPIKDSRGELRGYLGFRHDTTERREIDSVRREIEEQVRLLGLATRDWVWSWDSRTDRIIHNKAFTDALGEVPGPRTATLAWWQQRVHPADLSRIVSAFTDAANSGKTDVTTEYRIRKIDGSYADVEDRVCFIRDARGDVNRVLGAMRDMTRRRRVEAAHSRFSQILESTTDFVAICTVGGLVLYVNAAGRKLLGWPEDKSIAGTHISALHPAWAAEIVFEEGLPSAIRDGTWSGETALLTANGKEIPVSQVVIAHRSPEGDLEFISAIIRDISEQKRQEVTRIEWANRYDAAIRASGQVLFDWNSMTNEITYGGDLEQLLGYKAEEMHGGLKLLRDIIHPDDLGAFDEEVQRVIETRDPFRVSFRASHRSGRVVHIDAKGFFFIDRSGEIGRMVGFFADVTTQKLADAALVQSQEELEARVAERTAELAEASRMLRERAAQTETVAQLGQRALVSASVRELLNDAAALVQQTLRVDFVSVMEWRPERTDLHAIADYGWPDPSTSGVALGLDSQSGYTLQIGAPVISENLRREKRFPISKIVRDAGAVSSVSVVIESSPQPVGVLIAFTRIARAFTQDDVNFLQSMANVLTAAIERGRSEAHVRSAHEAAEAANRAKSEFLSRMSHELRTPLNAILGFTQLLELDAPTKTQAESIGHISKAGQHLLSLINEVLDIARIESDRLPLVAEPIESYEFVRETIDLIRPLAHRHQIDVILGADPMISRPVLADRQRLKQVLLNLLSNAVKYNRPLGSVTVSCLVHQTRFRVEVIDTGMGIPADKLHRLFLPFERLGAETTNIEGTGLGLALSQRIVDALGGELGYQSTPGEGSTFWIELPFSEEGQSEPIPLATTPAPSPVAAPAPRKRHKLVYIEDQDLNLRLVERILAHRTGYELIPVTTGGKALETVRLERPDIILLDLNLPDMTGDQVLRALKSDPQLAETPVIMVSADAMGDRIQQLLELGADGYLTKPYKLQEFFAVIEAALPPP
jgi:PAS domain S-box-containing protein